MLSLVLALSLQKLAVVQVYDQVLTIPVTTEPKPFFMTKSLSCAVVDTPDGFGLMCVSPSLSTLTLVACSESVPARAVYHTEEGTVSISAYCKSVKDRA